MARRNPRGVTVDGLDRLARRLRQLEPAIRDAAVKAVRDAADSVREDTRDSVRVDTGRLRNGVQVRVREARLVAEVGWFDRETYYARFQEFGTKRIPANPALTRAAQVERRKFPRRLTDDVRREIDR